MCEGWDLCFADGHLCHQSLSHQKSFLKLLPIVDVDLDDYVDVDESVNNYY